MWSLKRSHYDYLKNKLIAGVYHVYVKLSLIDLSITEFGLFIEVFTLKTPSATLNF